MTGRRQALLAGRFALREMRGGLKGFWIFIACIALGVAAIGGVNSVSEAISRGVGSQGQTLLGGDIRFELVQRRTGADELAFLQSYGTVSEQAEIRSMARLADGSDQMLVEVKAVDDAYPLYGVVTTTADAGLGALLAERDRVHGALAPAILFERLGLEEGDTIRVGEATFELRAKLLSEPDAISGGFGFAPRLMISAEGLEAAGLVQPGSLIEFAYKVRMEDDASEAALAAFAAEAEERFPEAGWSVRTRLNAAPSLASNIERFSQFLTLVGLTALVVGGVGVANAVRAYLDTKSPVIATFKSLGAPGSMIFALYLIQVVVIAAIGIAIGLVAAMAMPLAASSFLATILPLPAAGGIYPGALALAALFGVLVTLAFSIPALGRARDVPATTLFREAGGERGGRARALYLAVAISMAGFLAALAVWFSDERDIAVIFVGAALAAFAVLRGVGWLVQFLARSSPQVSSTALRLALGNIHRAGALTPSVVLSLGLGLTLLVALALIDGNLRRQIAENLPEAAPNFFFVDIQNDEIARFSNLLAEVAPDGRLMQVPMLRGRIVALDGTDLSEIAMPAEGAWVLRGDRGITYARDVPENSRLVAGEWWAPDHAGEPLVSFSAEEAGEIGLAVGDTITVNVLGRNVTARVANLRQVEWESLGINFVMVFSPNAFAGAPHAWLATLTAPQASVADEARVLNAVTQAFPTVTSVRVKDALDVVNAIIAQLSTAIRAAASVALVASVLVLAGALAAGHRARIHDAVVLKTLGATRRTLIAAFTIEYALIGLATAVFALAAGGAAAWFVVARIMGLEAGFLPEVAVATILVALVVTVGFGLTGTWRVLGQKAAPALREL